MDDILKQIEDTWIIYHDPKIKTTPSEARIILNQIFIIKKLKELFKENKNGNRNKTKFYQRRRKNG